jgi:protein TonB
MPQEKLNDRIVHLSEPPPLDPKTVPPPMPPVVPPPARPIIIFIIPKVIEDEKVMDEAMPPTQDEMKAVDISTKTQDGVENGISEGIGIEPQEEELPPVVEVPVIKKDEVFIIVEQMPKYDGGDKAFADFLRENLIYPLMARENGIEGTVVIRFIVNMDGSIVEPRIARDVAGGCGEEALRVVKAMPKWQPGKQRGVPVRVQFNLPIKFKLQQ